MEINMKAFEQVFNKEVLALKRKASDEYAPLVEKFDKYLHTGNNVDFVHDFSEYRKGRYVTSALECAAFIKALDRIAIERNRAC